MQHSDKSLNSNVIPEDAFEALGGGEIAYVRSVLSEDLESVFPNVSKLPNLQPGMRLWALLNADGTPIMLTDSKAAAEANAMENDLKTVSVH